MAKSEETLEAELAEAVDAYRDNLDDPKAKAKYRKATDALVAARQARRGPGVSIGGDATISGNEG
jgi:hypothetical protein